MNEFCGFTNDEIQEFLDSTLSPERTRALVVHLKDCHHCAGRLKGFEAVDTVLRDLETLTVPSDLHASILTTLRLEPVPTRWPRLATTAALVVLSALVVGWFFGPGLDVGPLSKARTQVSTALGTLVEGIVGPEGIQSALSGLLSSFSASAPDLPLSGWPLLVLFLTSLAVAACLNVAAFRKMRRGSL